MPPKLPSRIGRYEVVDRIGAGGMGILYLARDPVLERTVAIKVLSVHNQELLERFAREARSAAGLMHHNIVTIYDVGDDDGRPFIAMEYVDGETMAEAIRRKSPLTIERKLELILELCSGLGYAHASGIIHRDIKPANLMITSGGLLKILDFGLARLATDETMGGLTLAGAVLGTPHYMSPEQIEGHRIDHRSDIFAVGLVLYELLTYRKAYPGDTPHSVLHKVLHTDPEPMSEVRGACAPELEQVVNRAIQKSADQRYQQLTSFADDLGRINNRLRTAAEESTLFFKRGDSSGAAGVRHEDSRPPTPAPSPGSRQIPNLDAIARRRTAQVDAHVSQAQQHLEDGHLEAAIEECERAVLLDATNARALDLLQRAHRGLEDRQVRAWLKEAETNLSQSALTAAAALIDKALALRPESPEAQQLQRALQDRRRDQERARERARSARAAIERGRANLRDGALDAAARSAAEALAHEPDNDEARTLKRQIADALEKLRQKLEHDQHATATIAAARGHAAAGDYQRAQRLLETFSPAHPLVDEAAAETAAQARRVEERAREERAREEERARQRRTLETEKARREAEREARERREQEIAQRQRQEAEARAREDLARTHIPVDSETDRIEAEIEHFRPEADEVVGPALDQLSMAADLQPGASAVQTPAREVATRTRRTYLIAAAAVAVVVVLVAGALLLRPNPSAPIGTTSEASETTQGVAVIRVPVTINAIPWAKVRIVPKDGAGSATEGTTPMVVDLQAGEYTLELRNDLFKPTSQNLTVGQGPQLVSVAMPGADVETIVTDVLGPPQ